MTIRPAIEATYANYRRVPTRKTLQLIFEVPLERAPDVHDTFGEPPVEGTTWVAIALLKPSALKQQLQQSVEIEREKDKEPRRWAELKLSQQAGIRCKEPDFWLFLNREKRQNISNEQDAATYVRQSCGVNRRTEFADPDNHDGRNAWLRLDGEYRAWSTAMSMGAA